MSENNKVNLASVVIENLRTDLESQINAVEEFIDTLSEYHLDERATADRYSQALSACMDFLDTLNNEIPQAICDFLSTPGAPDAFIQLLSPYCQPDTLQIDPDDIPPAAQELA